MARLNRVCDLVVTILCNHPSTRNSDDELYRRIIFYINRDALNLSVQDFLSCRKELGIPSFETVRRSRQKAMEEYPDLKAESKVRMMRKAMEEEFKEFARS